MKNLLIQLAVGIPSCFVIIWAGISAIVYAQNHNMIGQPTSCSEVMLRYATLDDIKRCGL